MKKIFDCGHSGKGQYCHRCSQKSKDIIQIALERSDKKSKLQQAEDFLDIDCKHVPSRVVERAAEIFKDIACNINTCFDIYNGKRIISRRRIISIPLGQDFRLLCYAKSGKITPLKLLSHEEYDKFLYKNRQM